jgi:hypothetical protein
MDDRQLAHHRRMNLATREAWPWFASHRQRITGHLTQSAGGSLAVWGAGNCNDLDLAALLGHYDRITLLDLDLKAIASGIGKQGLADTSRIEPIQADAVNWATLDPGTLDQFDTVASLGILSQILHYAQIDHEAASGATWADLESLRSGHVQLLLRMTKAGGGSLLFNDFLSSDTCPLLLQCDEFAIASLVEQALSQRNFFTGLNPLAVEQLLRNDPGLRSMIAESHLSLPWRWHFGPRKCYAVCLHHMLRSGGA